MDETQQKIKEFLSRFFKNHDLQPTRTSSPSASSTRCSPCSSWPSWRRSSASQVEDEDLDLDNFRSIDAISELVARKRGAAA